MLRKTRAWFSSFRMRRFDLGPTVSRFRICRFECMEPRQLLSASPAPIHFGATYFEDSNDIDQSSALQGTTVQAADLFQIGFTGGASGTQLTSLTINLVHAFFDTSSAVPGAYGSFPLTILRHDGFQIDSYSINDGGTQLTMHFTGFDAGEKLVFTVDVDEQGNLNPNAVLEGAEIEGATIGGTFSAPHMNDAPINGAVILDEFAFSDSALAALLPNDNYNNAAALAFVPEVSSLGPVYTAGAEGSVTQTPLPITLSGTVFEDLDMDNTRDADEPGIGGVLLTLYEQIDGQYVSTGLTAATDAAGHYVFNGLMPGTYRVVETQPDGYLSVGAIVGTVGGIARGAVADVNILSAINLVGGDDGVHYDFGEIRPAKLCGYVYHDADNDGVFDAGESQIAGVELTLLDAHGNPTGATVLTDATGNYCFSNLMPGVYGVTEAQPAGYYDGIDTAGTAGGTAHNPGDFIEGIPLTPGAWAKQNNFGELMPASIRGIVFVDMNQNGAKDSGESFLGGVTIYLLDASGSRIASTTTDANGQYVFDDLKPGVYGVEEIQPQGYLEGGNRIGSASGELDGVNRILKAQLNSGVHGVHYDFWEELPAKISGYVFQDGPAIVVTEGDPLPYVPSVRDGQLTPDDMRLAGVTLILCDAGGYPLDDGHGNQITAVTNADGYYEFTGLYAGIYSVVEVVPTGYVSGVDTVGSHGGLVVNQYAVIAPSILNSLSVGLDGKAIVQIQIDPGDAAVQYNFSHVVFETRPPKNPPDDPPGPPFYPDPPYAPPLPPPQILPFVETRPVGMPYLGPPQVVMQPLFGGGGGPGGYTWHLSIIDAGHPRGDASGNEFAQYPENSYFDPVSWSGANMDQAAWTLTDSEGKTVAQFRFGMNGAIPVTGDWNGDGTTEIGAFLDGLWFLDLNGNGVWDEGDLWVKLGKKGDQPVTGDWNGDGKTDIGIFGPTWIGDARAIAAEPGLPDSQNPPKFRPKNVPPDPTEAAVGYRTLKCGTAGAMRSDLIDHVFQFGTKGDRAVTGDWNGDDIHTIGIFRDGTWFLDLDGDGRWSEGDAVVEFGRAGDLPVVGDWTGDGVSKLGVYRNGKFLLDINNNRQLDDADKVIETGSTDGLPIVGDWDANGIDEVGVYQGGAAADPQT